MNFGKILMTLMTIIEQTLPEWKDQFLSYKDLKKQLKLIYPNKRQKLDDDRTDDSGIDRKEVNGFVELLEKEIDKFNFFFLGKEEDFIIELKVLRDRVAGNRSSEELWRVGRDLVDLHGQMVLLLNYSNLNYTGLVKILKKYDKHTTGALIRVPVIQKVLKEPFFEVDVINKLVKECEAMLSREPLKVLGIKGSSGGSSSGVKDADEPADVGKAFKEPGGEGSSSGLKDAEEPAEIEKPSRVVGGAGSSGVKDPEELKIENMGNRYLNLTKSSLSVLLKIRSGSSTVNMFSLPPLEKNEIHEVWKNIPVMEQVAK